MNRMLGCGMVVLALVACGRPDDGAQDDSASALQAVEGGYCPELQGTFDCPAWNGQPAYVYQVTERRVGSGKEYTYYYSYLGPDPAYSLTANKQGVPQFGFIAQCTRYKHRKSMVFYPQGANPETDGTYNFINSNGDYQADFGGTTAIVCTRR